MQGDFHTVKLQGQYDTVYASAVFMHLFPDLTEAARRAHKLLRDTGRLCFDVPPGDFSYIDPGFKLFVKHYSKPYLHGYIATAGFTYCTVEREADFAPDSEGWFVSASKQPLPACAPA